MKLSHFDLFWHGTLSKCKKVFYDVCWRCFGMSIDLYDLFSAV